MIPISLTTAIAVYSILLGTLALAIWVYTEFKTHRIYRVLEKQFLWRCVFCGYIYLDEEAENLSQCPRCESFNSVKDKRARYVPVTTPANLQEPVEESEPQRDSSHRKRPHQHRRGPRKRSR